MNSKDKWKLLLFYVLQALVITAPILTVIIIKRNDYFRVPEKAFSLSFACISALVIMIFQILGKMPKNVHVIIKSGILTVFLWMIRPILDDLCLLLTCAFGGELLGIALFSKPIRLLKKRIECIEYAEIKRDIQSNETSGRV